MAALRAWEAQRRGTAYEFKRSSHSLVSVARGYTVILTENDSNDSKNSVNSVNLVQIV